MKPRALFPLLVFLLSSIGALAQEAGERRVIPLGVHTEDGKVVGRLRREQVQVKGVEADWDLAFDQGPRRIVLLLDVSGSMSDTHKWQRALDFTRAFIGLAAEEDELALHIFAESYTMLVPFTLERQRLLEALDSLPHPATRESRQATGNLTYLKAALLLAVQKSTGFGGAIVLVSDTVPVDGSRTRDSQVQNALANRAIRLMYVNVAFPTRGTEFDFTGAPLTSARGIVGPAGGGFYYLWHSAIQDRAGNMVYETRDLDAVARLVYLHTKYLYRLELRLKEPLVKKRKILVLITDKEIKREYNPQLFYPSHLYPAKSAGE